MTRMPGCSQCGQPFYEQACGPDHAARAAQLQEQLDRMAMGNEKEKNMPRYLVLEVDEEIHDLTDYLEDMRNYGKVRLLAGEERGYPFVLNVKIPTRPLVNKWAVDNDPRNPRQFYVEEAY